MLNPQFQPDPQKDLQSTIWIYDHLFVSIGNTNLVYDEYLLAFKHSIAGFTSPIPIMMVFAI